MSPTAARHHHLSCCCCCLPVFVVTSSYDALLAITEWIKFSFHPNSEKHAVLPQIHTLSSSSLVFNGSLHSSMSHYCHLSDFTTYRLSSNSPVLYFSKTGKSFRSLLFIGTIWSSIQQQNFKMSNLY